MGVEALEALVGTPSHWLAGVGHEADLVLSTRVRLARNLTDMPFSQQADEEALRATVSRIVSACDSSAELGGGSFLPISELDALDREFLAERHLISHEMLSLERPGGLYLASGERASAMVNEEDHLRLQAVVSGLDCDGAWDRVRRAEEELDTRLEFAFSEELGYLTACPTNVGTGMRASVFMHLPSLVLTKKIRQVLRGVSQVGLTVRGFYGEGSEILGNFFQVSNQHTLGHSETDILANLEKVVRQVIDAEVRARGLLTRDARVQIEDKVYRAYGVLRNARMLPSQEMINLTSAVRFGAAIGIGLDVSLAALNELLVLTQPAHLQKMAGRLMTEDERNEYRAEVVRQRLAAHPEPGETDASG
ncbi:MAG: protein arginine kinase [Candidatus Eiseniibacteriota bacterium]|jgi:protein arginine kinase